MLPNDIMREARLVVETDYAQFKKLITDAFRLDPVLEESTERYLPVCKKVIENFSHREQYAITLWFVKKFLEDLPFSTNDYLYVTGLSKKTLFDAESLLFDYYLNSPIDHNRLIYAFPFGDRLARQSPSYARSSA